MASRGDVQEQVMFATSTALPFSTTPDLPAGLDECCYNLMLFVDVNDLSNTLRNDQTSYFKHYAQSFSGATLTIQKCVGGLFVDQHVIIDNTYGTFKDFGVEVKNNLNYISIKNILWSAVRIDFGLGEYRIVSSGTDIFANEILDSSFVYHVKDYSDSAIDNTVFIKVHNSGLLGSVERPQNRRVEFPDGWEDAIRIQGLFGGDSSDYEEEHTRLNDGFEEYTKHTMIPKYLLDVDRAPQNVLNFLRNEILMANRIFMTNYNTNSLCHVNTEVRRSGNFDPERIKRVTNASVQIEFRSAFDNTYKSHCTI